MIYLPTTTESIIYATGLLVYLGVMTVIYHHLAKED